MVKLAHNIYFRLGVLMSSTVAVQTIGWNQSTHALASNNSLTEQLPRETDGLNSVQSPQNPPLFSPIFNLLAFSFDSLPLNLFSGQSDSLHNSDNFLPISIIPRSQPKPANSVSPKQEQYLANAQSVAKALPPSLIYQVKQGDTITKIASEYQIPSHELVELNQIQDSNIIFVDQRLQIPATTTQNSTSNTNSPAIANINTNKANSPSISPPNNAASEDPYIANLRAEIDQLRAQFQQEQEQAKKPGQKNDANSTGLVSLTDQPTEQRVKTNTRTTSATAKLNKLTKLNSPSLQTNPQSKLIKQDAIALKLPPLSDSEEYLPNIFDGYAWPAEGVLSSGYGWRWGRMHEGIDI
ncbi:MAG: LysM peptidoglycan-binding domain-containing protein, partial [Hydrococcus sp. SU_1_0]|nr:LysM peptidoglycan-binding domain-containing protein [Hydrococcus sp. SU_1_0]